jgi:hypothetical protein
MTFARTSLLLCLSALPLSACSGGSFEVAAASDASSGDDATDGSIVRDTSADDTLGADVERFDALANDTADADAVAADGQTDTLSDALGVDAPPACDPAEKPIDAGAVFVDVNATDGGDGTRLRPFKTVGAAMSAAATSASGRILVAPGRYGESLAITVDGVFVVGGWTVVGATWTRDCSPNAREKTVIASPTHFGAVATGLTKRSGLRLLTVSTKPVCTSESTGSAESCVGVIVANGSGTFVLDNVAVVAGAGGNGSKGADATPAVSGPLAGGCACDTTLAVGTSGVDGANGANGGHASPGGFGPARGYVPGDGITGKVGGDGKLGGPGGLGVSSSKCVSGCTDPGSLCLNACSDVLASPSVSSGAGKCGCPAKAGTPGAGGGGGGASIGVFATGTSQRVELVSTSVRAGDGGDGASGGAPGAGAFGSDGAVGADALCKSGCAKGSACTCAPTSTSTLAGGAKGGRGGNAGGAGGGGGGAGGPSAGLVNIGGAVIAIDSTVVVGVGGAGTGADGSPDGFAAVHFP